MRSDGKFEVRPVPGSCLRNLLGIGPSRFKKSKDGQPDARYGSRGSTAQRGPGAAAVDQFLRFQYNSLAETLPDKSLE